MEKMMFGEVWTYLNTLLLAGVGFFVKRHITKTEEAIDFNHKEITDVRLKYVHKDDFTKVLERMDLKLDRIEEKIDKKQDRRSK